MMKWKVVKNPRSSSADRSLECLKNDVQQSPQQNNNANNDTNNNVGDENKPDNVQVPKETNRQRESSLVRKPSVIATECINLKSILGLTRQRSETNLSNLGLIGSEYRRSRSEVRGVSCDRLTIGYHHSAPGGNHVSNGKTRSSSPPSRSGWLRGRKRERESRNPVKNNLDVFGKTVVTGSNRKRTSSKSRNGDCRTIVDGSDSKQKNKLCPSEKSSFSEHRKSKGNRRSGDDDIIEEEIYTEINQDNVRGKLLEENPTKDVFKDPNRVIRKKGMAPKPQITTTLFKESNGDVNLYPTAGGSSISLNEVPHAPPNRKPPRKNQTFSCRNQERRCENRAIQSVKMNNLKNSENALVKIKNNINAQSVVAVAEIHGESCPMDMDNENKREVPDTRESPKSVDEATNKPPPEPLGVSREGVEEEEEALPFHIDTPDYSTLDSVNCNSFSLSTEDILNCNTDCEESLHDSDNAKVSREISLSSILRDSTAENKTDSEPKKTVRFEKLDLIEKYKKHKTESCMDTEDDTDVSVCESSKGPLDLNSNEIEEPPSLIEEPSHCSDMQTNDEPNSMTVNVVVRSPSPAHQSNSFQGEELPTPPPFVAKKSFVLTIAKQEKGFRSLCANKKPDPIIPEPPPTPTKADQQISVTFLCSGPPSEPWVPPDRLRSTSVPPQSSLEQPTEVMAAALSAIRGRSRERKSKEKQHCKKNHKARKKDAVFVMPQAVIDELSQVLEKRKPSLDEIPVHP